MMSLTELRAGGKGAVARALTRLETHPDAPDMLALLDAAEQSPRGATIGLTGPPGVGKSSLCQALIAEVRARGLSIAIIAVDPSSARTKGALLGDRTRIDTDPDDGQVFLRSMAARGALGGLAAITYPATLLLRALFDLVIVETVGVGQSEIEVASRTDGVVFCAQPGSGDALQFMKAGVMEIPDMVVITKGDMGTLAERAAADLRGAFSLDARGDSVPISVVSAQTGQGIADLVSTLQNQIAAPATRGDLAQKRAAQTRDWLAQTLRDEFGEAGLSYVRQALSTRSSPVQARATLRHALASALARGWSISSGSTQASD